MPEQCLGLFDLDDAVRSGASDASENEVRRLVRRVVSLGLTVIHLAGAEFRTAGDTPSLLAIRRQPEVRSAGRREDRLILADRDSSGLARGVEVASSGTRSSTSQVVGAVTGSGTLGSEKGLWPDDGKPGADGPDRRVRRDTDPRRRPFRLRPIGTTPSALSPLPGGKGMSTDW